MRAYCPECSARVKSREGRRRPLLFCPECGWRGRVSDAEEDDDDDRAPRSNVGNQGCLLAAVITLILILVGTILAFATGFVGCTGAGGPN